MSHKTIQLMATLRVAQTEGKRVLVVCATESSALAFKERWAKLWPGAECPNISVADSAVVLNEPSHGQFFDLD